MKREIKRKIGSSFEYGFIFFIAVLVWFFYGKGDHLASFLYYVYGVSVFICMFTESLALNVV